jgi:mannose-6-phosphate isomerase-like protein (cupin superfamily)
MAPSVIRCVHLFTGTDGHSHVEHIELPLGAVTLVKKAHFEETAAGSSLDWHTAPCEQFVVTLSGTLEFTTRDGENFTLRPGDILLASDTSGTGHRWRLIDDQPWRRLYVELATAFSLPGSNQKA